MFNTIMKTLKRPMLWERSDKPFWDDEHISKSMLDAHLCPDTDAASRRMDTIDASVKWLSTVLPEGCALLDLGCGPGLYTSRLSALGYDVTGMDLSRRSIEYAAQHDEATKYIRMNYLELDEHERYDVITLIYCDYAALTAPERLKLLSCVREALKPGGLFIFDVFTDAHFRKHKPESMTWFTEENGGFWSDKPYLCLDAMYLYQEGLVAADRHVVITKDGVADHIIWDTAFNKESLREELGLAGLSVREIYADACGKPYYDDSEMLCCIAYK